jgi:hypothetical protein
MGGGDAVSEDYAGNEAALDSFTILYRDVTAVDECLFLCVPRVVATATSKQGNEGLGIESQRKEEVEKKVIRTDPDVEIAIETISELATALILIP